ncbi:MAG: aminotransferase class V-fold PLP-dependent enzyme [Gemmatimonadetes bacterium]|nr:aminotransferase class V-fold PLP-dependent enzyme [Gemmatimonadota bacterium]MBI3569478.1 aminotransferase class V-fold PLP-dependent enzyme [Gemmatimonadota bacterium]
MSFDVHAFRAKEYPWAERGESIFFDHAATGPLPQRTRDLMERYGLKRAEPFRLTMDDFFPVFDRARANAAKLVHAPQRTIALMSNTSHGVNLAARALPYGPGDVVLSVHGEFPANVYPWMIAARRRGAEHRLLPLVNDWPDEAALMRAIETDPRIKVVALSWVSFWSGYRFDLAAIGAACRARGIYFVVDAIQGLGPLTLDLATTHVDILACGAQKWLLSPWGCGFAYVRDELIAQLEPEEVGWTAQASSGDFGAFLDYDPTWHDDARRYEVITLDYVHFNAMAESLGMFLEVGPEVIAARVRALADRAVAFADAHTDVTLVTPRDPAHRAGVLSFRTADVPAASQRLRAAKVAHTVREGCVRLSPHFYNTDEELDAALALLAR